MFGDCTIVASEERVYLLESHSLATKLPSLTCYEVTAICGHLMLHCTVQGGAAVPVTSRSGLRQQTRPLQTAGVEVERCGVEIQCGQAGPAA